MPAKFIAKLLLCISPFILIISALIAGGIYTGELIPPHLVARLQSASNEPMYYESYWTRPDIIAYKRQSILLRDPDVLFLGSSRGSNMLGAFFPDEDTFYNGHVQAMTPSEIRSFLRNMISEGVTPEIIIINVDYHYFATTYIQSAPDETLTPYNSYDTVMEHFRSTARDWLENPQTYLEDMQSRRVAPFVPVGLSAVRTGNGFRNDGSYYRPIYDTHREQGMAVQLELFDTGGSIYVRGDELATRSIVIFNDILTIAQANDIIVVGFIPPFQTIVNEQLTAENGFGYVPQVRETLPEMFASYNMPFFDFTSVEAVGGNDLEMFDLHHAGEILSWRVLTEMVAAEPELFAPYVTLDYLQSLTPTGESHIYFFGNSPYPEP